MCEMRVAEVGFTHVAGSKAAPVVLLREVDGDRCLPIWIGQSEAGAIAIAAAGLFTPRPLTHALIVEVIEALGRQLDQVVISELRRSTFLAELVFDGDIRVSARPSDAIAVALNAGVVIRAADAVLAQAAVPASVITCGDDPGKLDDPPPEVAIELEQFREFLNHARPEDFGPEGDSHDKEG